MAPKFKGDSEDWLDDERSSKKGSKKRKPKNTGPAHASSDLDQVITNGLVAEVYPKQCLVLMDTGERWVCGYRRATVFGAAGGRSDLSIRERTPVAVGDRVQAESTHPKHGVVIARGARANVFLRPAPDRKEHWVHVLASNLDILCIVSAAVRPEFSAGVLDRFLVAAIKQGIRPVIVVNKSDLLETSGSSPRSAPWEIYRQLGYALYEVSAKKDIGISELRSALLNHRVAFCGHSGVGKTSLLRMLTQQSIGKIAEVSDLTGKGRHTTTSAHLLIGPESSQWIDTPGVREFGLFDVKPEQLKDYFPEMQKCSCLIQGCLHLDEEGCQARVLQRYTSYRRILTSLMQGEF